MIVGQKVGHRYAVSEGQGTIGRDPSNAIQIVDTEVSRIHCRYQAAGDRLEVADLQSANGTFVNGKAIERCRLNDGDRIKIGSTVLEVKIEEAVGETTSRDDLSVHENLPAWESPSDLSYFPVTGNQLADDASGGAEGAPNRMARIARDMNFIYRASLVASSNAAPDEMLNSLIDLVFDWGAADRCCVLLRDHNADQLKIRASRARDLETDQEKLSFSQCVVDYVCEHRVSILTPNTLNDQRLSGKDLSEPIDGREAICVPIHGRNEFQGVLYIDAVVSTEKSEVERFDKNSLKLMIAIGRQIGFAIENERYFVQLREQQPLVNIGQTTSSLTHHVKNVLQGIYGGSHLVETGLESENIQTVKTGWAIVNRNQLEISNIVNNMLIFGNPYDPHLTKTDLNDIITKVFEEIGPSLARRGIQYDWKPSDGPEIFKLDPRGIHWALQNLISCCVTACHGQTLGKIKITLDRSSSEKVVIAISDNSLPAEEKNVKDPFSAAMSEPVHNMNSVELAVSRKLIQGHGGQIDVQHPKSGGNLFLVQLPAQ